MASETIDLTPTWESILPTWLMLFEQAIEGDCTNPDLIKANARKELTRMAQAADLSKRAVPLLRLASQFTAGELTNSQFINAVLDWERGLLEEQSK